MKLILIGILAVLLSTLTLDGQVEYLRLSPSQKIIQRVGMTNVEIEFSRPQMKGRQVFGQLVPYNQMWRTGANENTKISFDHRVRIGDIDVAKGTYNLLTLPKMTSWDIYLYTTTDHLDVPDPIDSTKLIYLTTVPSYQLEDPQETLVINIYDITETSANLGISWEHTDVKIPISFYTNEAMEKMIEREFKQNIFDYSIAASYYSQRNMNLEKAKMLMKLSIDLRDVPSAWAHHEYAIILKKLGELKEAKENLEYSLQLAKKTGNTNLTEENQKLLNELEQH